MSRLFSNINANNLLPNNDNNFSLGSNNSRWREIYMGPGTLNISGPLGFTGVATLGSDADGIAYTEFGFATPFINIGPEINIPQAVGGWRVSSTGTAGTQNFDLVVQQNTSNGPTGPIYSLINNFSPTGVYWVAKNGYNPPTGNGTFDYPFLTINQAINAATGTNGTAIWVMPGTYNESFTLPENVTLRGQSLRTVNIALSGVTGPTSLVTMGKNSRLEDVSLNLSSNSHYNLNGILFDDDTAFQAKVATINCTVTNSNASQTGTSDIYAINFNTNASNISRSFVQQIQRATIVVNSIGAGNKAAISITGDNNISVRDLNLYCYDWGTGTNGSGTGFYYGVHLNDGTGARIDLKSCSVFGGSYYGYTGAFESSNLGFTGINGNYADISQTAGSIQLTGVDLVNANANGKSFTTGFASSNLFFGYIGTLSSGDTGKYLYPGSVAKLSTLSRPIGILLNSKRLINRLSVVCITTPDSGVTDTFTLYKNNNPTNLKVTLVNGQLSNQSSDNVSVSFGNNDKISIVYTYLYSGTPPAGNGSEDPVVNVSLY